MHNNKNTIKCTIIIVLCVILGLLAIVIASAYFMVNHYHGKTNYIKDDEMEHIEETDLPEEIQKDLEEEKNEISEEQAKEEEIQTLTAQKEAENIVFQNKDVYNLLLIGVDLRPGENWNGNSDVMILVSINRETKTIYLTSFMRDSYAIVADRGGHKLNFAHALGGGPLLVSTIENNYKIKIDNYARGNFDTTAKIVDLMGGVDIPLYQEECNHLTKMGAGDFTAAGTYHLNGEQAVAYGRIRYVGNNDYERTERQRRVIAELFKKMKEMPITKVNSLANEILPLITHNVDELTVLSLLAELPCFLKYELVMDRIPYDGHFHSSGEKLVPDWDYTIKRLHDTIYATEKTQVIQ